MSLTLRLNKIRQRAQPLIEKQMRKEQRLEANERLLKSYNKIMSIAFAEHPWNELPDENKLDLSNIDNKNSIYVEVLYLTREFDFWVERNSDKPSKQLDALWEQHKPEVLEYVNRQMVSYKKDQ